MSKKYELKIFQSQKRRSVNDNEKENDSMKTYVHIYNDNGGDISTIPCA